LAQTNERDLRIQKRRATWPAFIKLVLSDLDLFAGQEMNDEQNEKDYEQDARDILCAASDAAEPENRSDNCDNKKDNCPA
jgi:hypothetical protein